MVTTLAWIVSGGIAMGPISLVGAVTFLPDETTRRRLVRPLAALLGPRGEEGGS